MRSGHYRRTIKKHPRSDRRSGPDVERSDHKRDWLDVAMLLATTFAAIAAMAASVIALWGQISGSKDMRDAVAEMSKLAAATARQASATQEQAKASHAMAIAADNNVVIAKEQARSSITEIERRSRAYLIIDSVVFDETKTDESERAEIRFINTGPTPAYNVVFRGGVTIESMWGKFLYHRPSTEPTYPFTVGREITREFFSLPLQKDVIDRITIGELGLAVSGAVDYDDALARHHHADFCYAANNRMLAQHTTRECPGHNSRD